MKKFIAGNSVRFTKEAMEKKEDISHGISYRVRNDILNGIGIVISSEDTGEVFVRWKKAVYLVLQEFLELA